MRFARSRVAPRALAAALLLAGAVAGRAEAARPPLVPDCACEARDELQARRDALATAPDLETARSEALADVAGARRALGIATWLAPESSRIEGARERIAAYEAGVRSAASRDEVAEHFARFVQLEDGSDVVGVDGRFDGGDGRCNFSDREIIAIVLGFILGIIPGLILLVLLC